MPFHLAVQNTGRGGSGSKGARAAQSAIIEAFLRQGIGAEVKDKNGKSVLEWAGSGAVRAMLERKD